MTGMEHAIEHAARAIYGAMHRDTDPYSVPLERAAEKAARRLAAEGLIAPAPLREIRERGTLSGGVLHFFGSSPSEYVKYHTDWLPVDRAEGDGSADQ